LTESKKLCGHGNWLPWLEREFGWEDRTALNFMQVHAMVGKSEKFADLSLPVSGLYLLAAPSTPEEVRDEVAIRAAAGEKITVADVRSFKERAVVAAKLADTDREPRFDEFKRTDGQIKSACDFNGEDPEDVEEPGDTKEMIRHRIFLHRASEASRHARENGFEQAAAEEITPEILTASLQAAEAWSDLTTALQRRAR
jgi:hypothetical protein